MPRVVKSVGAAAEIEFFGPDVSRKLKKHRKASAKRIALQTEAHAKVNIGKEYEHADGEVRPRIVTGTMLNNVKTVLDQGRLPLGAIAAVVATADYAAYQEDLEPWLEPAAVQSGKDAVRAAKSAWREVNP